MYHKQTKCFKCYKMVTGTDTELAEHFRQCITWKGEDVTDNYVKEGVSPHHYAKYPIEPITFIIKNSLPFPEGNVIKYVMRHADKDGLKDLKKAKRYLDILIEHHYGKEHVDD